MARDFFRLIRPSSICVIGGGAWCAQIILQSQRMGYEGSIHAVHPRGIEIEGITAVQSLADLPLVPDAVFIGVNRHATVNVVAELAEMGAGGAVCFASGFSEAAAEESSGVDLQAQLVAAAGEMPVLGPNCYGFINALEGALLWPDQHGCQRVERGVAILTQSSNIAINLTMQQRGLPIAYMIACGNMAQTTQAQIALDLLDDAHVTAIGLHIEGFADTAEWHEVALKAQAKAVPLIALKVGKSTQAQVATVSHTASMAGSDAGAAALLTHLGIGRVLDLPTFVETLKLLHCCGPLDASTLSSISCSGGEASLAADTVEGRALSFPPLMQGQRDALADALGPMVALANPLDYNTYIWRDAQRMADAWAAMAAAHIGLTLIIVDYPHTDAADWVCATQAALEVRRRTGRPVAMVATLPELMPADVAAELMVGGVIPMNGLTEAISAAEIAAHLGEPTQEPPLQPGVERIPDLLSEAEAKKLLAQYGMQVPRGATAVTAQDAANKAKELSEPLVLKAMGMAHKSDAGGVVLGLRQDQIETAAAKMPTGTLLIEEMVQGGVAEVLVGVTRDPAHGFVLTVGAGGVLTELWQDTQSLLIPATAASVEAALRRLRIWPLLDGYRGKMPADLPSVIASVMAVQALVIAHCDVISEVEINPLICTATNSVAVDALIRSA
ncbi:acyl-CoA synthetase [Sulfitobacter sp. SK012]|uniref:acetate--CoA ligase family protein n=1 Tax=Sulfitobacter sp. SK012 TaxID=1389005 RepID=UPI000E0BAB1D|nr:acetate--CoA ligase family protein [Sulfitobacter sp. SK012]AXI48449.1 acyl-CoA synthetase [Sulfitobacter sp. SK012]